MAVRANEGPCHESAERASGDESEVNRWFVAGSSALSKEDAALWCVAWLSEALCGVIAGPVYVVRVRAPAAVALTGPSLASLPVAAFAISSVLDNCGPGNCAGSEGCDGSEDCAGADGRTGLDNCFEAGNSAGPDDCAGSENCFDRPIEGAKFGADAEIVAAVCARVGISDRAGAAGIWIGASMVGAMACALPFVDCALTFIACAAFFRSGVEVAEATRFRFAPAGRSVVVASALSAAVV